MMPYAGIPGPRYQQLPRCGSRKQQPEQEHECVCIRDRGHKERWHRCDHPEHTAIGAWTGGDYPGRSERIEV